MNVFELFAKLSLDSSGYDEGLDGAEQKAQSFGSKLSGGLATAAKVGGGAILAIGSAATTAGGMLVKSTGSVAAYGDNIDKMSQKMGLSAQAYQEWDAILRHSGTSIEAMKGGMKTLANAVETGSDAFAALGMSQEQIAGMSQEELFGATITALQNVEDETQRTYLASKLLGKGGTELGALLNTSAEDTEKMRQKVHDLGGVMSDEAVKSAAKYQDSLLDMKTAFSGLSRGLVSNFLPGITTVMDGLSAVFSGDSEQGLGLIKQGIDNVLQTLTESIPQFMEIAKTIITALGQAILDNLPTIIETATEIIINLATGLIEALPQLVEAGITILVTLIQTIIQKLPDVLNAGKQMLSSLAGGFSGNVPEMIKSIGDVISKGLAYIMQNLPSFLQKGIEVLSSVSKGILNDLPEILAAIGEVIAKVLTTFVQNLPKLLQQGIELIAKVAAGIIQAIPKVIQAIPQVIRGIINGFTGTDWGSVGSNIIGGIANGIRNGVGTIIQAAKDAAQSAFDAAKRFLGIASPSKLFRDKVGKYISEGMAQGILDEADAVSNAIEDVSAVDPYDLQVSSLSVPDGQQATTDNRSVVFNIYQQPGEDGEELARIIEARLVQWDDQERMVFA